MLHRRFRMSVVAVGLVFVLDARPTHAQIRVLVDERQTAELAASVTGLAGPNPFLACSSWLGGGLNLVPLRFMQADQRIKQQSWLEAARVLHTILDAREARFVRLWRTLPDGETLPVVLGAHFEANRLLGMLPASGLEEFRKLASAPAAERLKQARQKADAEAIADVATRYYYTPAGTEALNALATYYEVRDDPVTAGFWLQLLLDRSAPDAPAPLLRCKEAMAAFRAGDKIKAEAAWRKVAEALRKDGGVTIDRQFIELKKLRAVLDQAGQREPPALTEWPLFRGGPARREQTAGGTPWLHPDWTISTLPIRQDGKRWIEENLNHAARALAQRQRVPLPSFFPVAVDGKLIYRTFDGVYAVDLKQEGKLAWYSDTDGGIHALLVDPGKKGYLEQWNSFYRQHGPQEILVANSALGALSTDGARVFVADGLVIPPHPYTLRNFGAVGPQPNFGSLAELVNHNSLKAYNLESGKLTWELGGRYDRKGELAGSFFLGPPLPLHGKLYLLMERDSALRLACLEARDTIDRPRPPNVLWTRTLAAMRLSVQFDIQRRTQAIHLASANGILVCPTNAGAVVGIDLLGAGLRWTHEYPRSEAKPVANPALIRPMVPGANFNLEWQVSAPAIVDERVVFTAPDLAELRCLRLRDGALLWKVARAADDLYFAGVVAGRALVVGQSSCRAIGLADGKEAWRLNVGTPSGQGAASGDVYYLPLKAGVDKEPEVCAIDVAKGMIVSHARSRKKEVPGNLIFYKGEVLSQTLTGIASFPQLQTRLSMIDARLKANPNDPVGLLERGELRLDRGEAKQACDDLRAALENKPPADLLARARTQLYEALTEYLQRDFAAAEKNLDDYKAMCGSATTTEGRQRLAKYYLLVGRGREQQGKVADALQAYLDFAASAGDQELMSLPGETGTQVRASIWVRGRITALWGKATPEQRKQLDAKLAEYWKSHPDKDGDRDK